MSNIGNSGLKSDTKILLELSQEVNDKREFLIEQWLDGDTTKLLNNTQEVDSYAYKLKGELCNDILTSVILDCGILIGTANTLSKLIVEKEIGDIHTYGSDIITNIDAPKLNNKMIILELMYNHGRISTKYIHKKLGFSKIQVKQLLENNSWDYKRYIDIVEESKDITVYELTDYGKKYIRYIMKKRKEIAKLVRDIYGHWDMRGHIFTDEEINSYLANIINMRYPKITLRQRLKQLISACKNK